jgi:O-antigen ligase
MLKIINKQNSKILNFMAIAFSILPIALFTGPFLPDLIVVILSFLFFFLCFKNKKFFFFKNFFVYFFIVFLLYLNLRSVFSESFIVSAKVSFFYIRYGIFVLSVLLILKYCRNIETYFYNIFYFSIFFVSFDVIFQFLFGVDIFGIKNVDPSRITGIFGSEAIVGSYLVRLIPLLQFLYFIKIQKKKLYNFFFISLLLVMSDIAILLSGERASFFYLLLSNFFLMIFSRNYIKFRMVSLIISIILMIVITANSSLIRERMFMSTFQEISIDKKDISLNNNNLINIPKNHNSHFQSAFNMFKNNILFGQGPQMFRILCSKKDFKYNDYSCSTHPHNNYIQLLAELGLIGFCFIIFILLFLIKDFGRLIFNSQLNLNLKLAKLTLFSSFLITLWPFVTTGNFFNNWLNVIYYLPIPFFINYFFKPKI